MKRQYAPAMVALILVGSVTTLLPANAQLPPCNMGKAVHQPGDNQYGQAAQMERHRPVPVAAPVTAGGGGGGGGAPVVVMGGINPMTLMGGNTPKVDISLDPISADEPVPAPGFPPMPERLQLPIATNSSWDPSRPGGGNPNWNNRGGGGGQRPAQPDFHQHYGHLPPGAYQSGGGSSGGGGGGGEYAAGGGGGGGYMGNGGGASRSSGYYKCTSPTASGGSGDTFNSSPGNPAPRYSGASSADLRALGKAPTLDNKQDTVAAPPAPSAAVVSQSTTQDLSLPDDEFASRYGMNNTIGKKVARRAGMMLYQGVNMGISRVYSIVP